MHRRTASAPPTCDLDTSGRGSRVSAVCPPPSALGPLTAVSPRRYTLLALLLALTIGVFYVATIRDGHVWGDDHAMYLAHAKNIVEGRAYADIGYIRPQSSINPLMYPPVYPLLLALPYHWYGLDLTPMKVVGIVCFCLGLFIFYLGVRQRGLELVALLTMSVVGGCPYFWDFKDSVYSEFPFLVFAYGSLLLTRPLDRGTRSAAAEWGWGLLTGLLCALAYGTRSPGIVLAPSILVWDWLRAGRVTRYSVSLLATFVSLASLQTLLFRIDSDYASAYQSAFSWEALLASPWYYVKCLAVPWDNGHNELLQAVVYGVLALLVVFGLRSAWRDRPRARACTGNALMVESERTVGSTSGSTSVAPWLDRLRESLLPLSAIEIFSALYVLFIVLFPWGGRRYLIPIMPVFVLYALLGLRALGPMWPLRLRTAARCAVMGAVVVTFMAKYSTLDWRQVPGGTQQPEVADLIEWVVREIPSTNAVVFRKARFLALYSGRTASDIAVARNANEVLEFYRQHGASHVVVSKVVFDETEDFLGRFVRDQPHLFAEVSRNRLFTLYRLQDGEARPVRQFGRSEGKTDEVAGLIPPDPGDSAASMGRGGWIEDAQPGAQRERRREPRY